MNRNIVSWLPDSERARPHGRRIGCNGSSHHNRTHGLPNGLALIATAGCKGHYLFLPIQGCIFCSRLGPATAGLFSARALTNKRPDPPGSKRRAGTCHDAAAYLGFSASW